MRQAGFTLLEAIVALVLIATTGMALLSWINTNLMSLYRVQQVQRNHAAIRNALAFMDTVNPLEKPEGEVILGIYTFKWRAQVIELPKDGISNIGAVGFYQIGLYETEVEARVDNELLAQFTLRQVGFKQVRKPLLEPD